MTQTYTVTSAQAEAARIAVRRNDQRGRVSSPELLAIANARRVPANGGNGGNGNGD